MSKPNCETLGSTAPRAGRPPGPGHSYSPEQPTYTATSRDNCEAAKGGRGNPSQPKNAISDGDGLPDPSRAAGQAAPDTYVPDLAEIPSALRYPLGMRDNTTLYDQDFYAWTREQSRLLREGRLSDADIANIAEEIESMGRGEKRELGSRLVVLLQHLLKWEHQSQRRGKSWELTIANARDDLADLLKDNPSLKPMLTEFMDASYARARRNAAGETRLSLKRFPEHCPWIFDQVMDNAFWPGPISA